MEYREILERLNADDVKERLDFARQIMADTELSSAFPPALEDVNNHIHSKYSFSPYSPTAAAYMSKRAGLATTGIMDHDSIYGAKEFSEAGRIFGIPTTQGYEIRVSFKNTFLEDKRINNPDQKGVAYVTMHGVPDTAIEASKEFLLPVRQARLARDKKMVDKLNAVINKKELYLDFDTDVKPLSWFDKGGEITERHLLYALANKLIKLLGKGEKLVAFLENEMKLELSAKFRTMLEDEKNPYYDYDLLGIFKAFYVASFYIDATDECLSIEEVAKFAMEQGIILAYPYLGDVTASVTGDKKAQTFEDEYLDELFPLLKKLNFKAITFMPSRNTGEQLARLMGLCEQYDFFQISGEDINQPRQEFICKSMRKPEFEHLSLAAWALIAHERLAAENVTNSIYSDFTLERFPRMEDRLKYFSDYAKELYRK